MQSGPSCERIPAQGTPDPRLNALWSRPELVRALNFWNDRQPAKARSADAPLDFRPALVDPRLFPFEVFRRMTTRQLRRMELKPPAFRSPQGNQGHFPLRSAIATHIGISRAVVCEPDDVLVTAGAQQAFDILARALVTPGVTTVASKRRAFPLRATKPGCSAPGCAALRSMHKGWSSTPSRSRYRSCACVLRTSFRWVYPCPRNGGRHCSTSPASAADIVEGGLRAGNSTSRRARRCRRCDPPQPQRRCSMSAPSPSACSPHCGWDTWSRPADRMTRRDEGCLSWHCPTLTQMAVARFITEGHLAQHVRKLRGIYRKRRILCGDAAVGLLGLVSRIAASAFRAAWLRFRSCPNAWNASPRECWSRTCTCIRSSAIFLAHPHRRAWSSATALSTSRRSRRG